MIVDIAIVAVKAFLVLFMVLNLAGILGWIERKGSALIQDRIGANRASILGFAGMGLVNTLIADPLKFLDQRRFHSALRATNSCTPWRRAWRCFTALVTFAVIPFGDVLVLGERVINLQVANLNIGILYVFAMGSLGVYGIVIGAWASNNKFSLLGGVRGSAQMISYEVAMGLSVIGILMVYRHAGVARNRPRPRNSDPRHAARSRRAFSSPLSAGCPPGAFSCSRWPFCFFSPPRLPRPNGSLSTCRKASRNWSPVIMSNIPAVSF